MGLVGSAGTVRIPRQGYAGLRPDQGGARAASVSSRRTRQIFPTLTVRQNLELGLKRAGTFGRWNFEDVFGCCFAKLKARQDTSAGVFFGGDPQMLTCAAP